MTQAASLDQHAGSRRKVALTQRCLGGQMRPVVRQINAIGTAEIARGELMQQFQRGALTKMFRQFFIRSSSPVASNKPAPAPEPGQQIHDLSTRGSGRCQTHSVRVGRSPDKAKVNARRARRLVP